MPRICSFLTFTSRLFISIDCIRHTLYHYKLHESLLRVIFYCVESKLVYSVVLYCLLKTIAHVGIQNEMENGKQNEQEIEKKSFGASRQKRCSIDFE